MTLLTLLQDQYALAVTGLTPITGGEENRNYLVRGDHQHYVLRLYSPSHSTCGPRAKSDIEFELRMLEHLRGQGLRTPAVIPTRAGALFTRLPLEDGPRWAALFAHVAGQQPEAYSAPVGRAAAGCLLDVRRALRAYPLNGVRPWPGDMIGLSLEFYPPQRAAIRNGQHAAARTHQDALDDLYQATLRDYAQVRAAGLPRGLIHGDIKLGNLLFSGDQLTAVIDFDDYHVTYLLEELARTVMHDLDSPTRNAIRAGLLPLFVQAFARDDSLMPGELAYLPAFLRARFLYDVTSYFLNGHDALVEELFADAGVQAAIFRR